MASYIARGDFRVAFSSGTATDPSLDRIKIAELPVRFIAEMSREELIRVIRAAQLPLLDSRALRRLPFLDRPALERLAHLGRRCCRTRRAQTTTSRSPDDVSPAQGRRSIDFGRTCDDD
jgi:hypothetical protein